MAEYLAIFENGESGRGAYPPDLPGCVAAAESREEVESLSREAVELHSADIKERGGPVPAPHSEADVLTVD